MRFYLSVKYKIHVTVISIRKAKNESLHQMCQSTEKKNFIEKHYRDVFKLQ